MQAISIAQNDTTLFVSIDKETVGENKLNLIEKLLRAIVSDEKLKIDSSKKPNVLQEKYNNNQE